MNRATSAERGATLAIPLDRSAREPLYRQIRSHLKRAILRGDLREGSKLPASRRLSRELGVSRNTVLDAYDLLVAEGLVKGKRGSATRVRETLKSKDSIALTVSEFQLMLRDAHYPSTPSDLRDPDGNALYVHR